MAAQNKVKGDRKALRQRWCAYVVTYLVAAKLSNCLELSSTSKYDWICGTTSATLNPLKQINHADHVQDVLPFCLLLVALRRSTKDCVLQIVTCHNFRKGNVFSFAYKLSGLVVSILQQLAVYCEFSLKPSKQSTYLIIRVYTCLWFTIGRVWRCKKTLGFLSWP